MERQTRKTMDVSSWWLQAVVLTFIIGFGILGYLAIRIYRDSPPVPARVVSESGQTVFTRDDIRAGQESFLTYGLMQYGSVYGHGAYLGPDFTADYLHRSAVEMRRAYGDTAEAAERVRRELRQNRYDSATDVLTWTDAQATAFSAPTMNRTS
jgi:nitric oxide reductase subunit B